MTKSKTKNIRKHIKETKALCLHLSLPMPPSRRLPGLQWGPHRLRHHLRLQKALPPISRGMNSWPCDLLNVGLWSHEWRVHLQMKRQPMQVLNNDLLSLVQGPEHLAVHVGWCWSGCLRMRSGLRRWLRRKRGIWCWCCGFGASASGPRKCDGWISGVPTILLNVCQVDHRA